MEMKRLLNLERCGCNADAVDAEKGGRRIYTMHLASMILERLASEKGQMASAEITDQLPAGEELYANPIDTTSRLG